MTSQETLGDRGPAAPEALAFLQERGDAILDLIRDGFFLIDRQWRLAYVNAAAAAQMGRDRDGLLGRSVWDVLPALRGGLVRETLERAMHHNEPTSVEVCCESAGRWLETRVYPTPSGVAVLMADTSARHAPGEADRLATVIRYRDENPNPVLRVGSEGQVRYANRAAERLMRELGWSPGAAIPAAMRLASDHAIAARGQATVLSLPGGRAFELSICPDADELSIYGREVTGRQALEASLREIQERFAVAQRAAHVGCWECEAAAFANPAAHVAWWSEETYRIFGFGPGAVASTVDAFRRLVHPEDRDRVLSALRCAAEVGGCCEVEHRIVRADGSERILRLWGTYLPAGQGRPARMLGTCQDVTELRMAEKALREREEQVELIIDRVPALISYIDLQFRYRWVNQQYERWFGTPASKIRGRHVAEVLGEEAWEATRPHMERALAGDEVTYEQHLPYQRGGPRWVHVMYSPDRDRDGRVRGFAVLVTDIAEAKRSEAELREGRERLRELNASLEKRVAERTAELERRANQLRALAGELTQAEQRERKRMSQVLHDGLQQMLVAAKMHAGAIAWQMKDSALADSAKALLRMLDESIATSRSLTASLSPAVLQHGDIVASIKWLADEMREKHGLQVDLELGVAAPLQEDLKLLLFHSLRELLFNVVKHSGARDAKVKVESPSDDTIVFTVSDRGRGFDPAGGIGDGSGFGLLSIRERLALLGGELQIDSAPGAGTTVRLIAPVMAADRSDESAAAPAAEVKPPPAEPGATPRVRVLVVDDHKMLREGLVSLMSEEPSIEVVGQAEDGLEAVERARVLRPDVVILDVTMPRMNGIEATRLIKRELPGVRVIGMSMHEDLHVRGSMREAGAAVFLNKGCASDTLIATILNARTE